MNAIELGELYGRSFSLNLSVGRRRALDWTIALSVQPGEIYGFLGPNGAGKTTSIKILVSLLRQDSGTRDHLRRRTGPGRDPAADRVPARVSGLLRPPDRPGVPRPSAGSSAGSAAPSSRSARDRLLEQVGLAHAADLQIRRYSKGMNQRVGIAQALLHDPELVILDEPMSGLDPIGRAEVRDLILDLKQAGKTVFFSTHIIPDVEMICDRIGLINRGRMVAEGTVSELLDARGGRTIEVLVENVSGRVRRCAGVGGLAASVPRSSTWCTPTRRWAASSPRCSSGRGRLVSVTPRREGLENLVVRLLEQDRAAASRSPR